MVPQFPLFRNCKLSINDLFFKIKYKVPHFVKLKASKRNEWSLIFEFQTENTEYYRGESNFIKRKYFASSITSHAYTSGDFE